MLPSISFETGRKTQTQSSVKTIRGSETANGSLVLSHTGTAAERPTHAAKIRKNLHPRSSAARRRAFALLTKTYHGSRVTAQVKVVTAESERSRLQSWPL